VKKRSGASSELANPNATMRTRELRRDGTDAEKRLWLRLRNRQLGLKFRRQSPMGSYFTDFCCKEAQLIIELDGDQHASEQGLDHDAKRTAFLIQRGYRVVRFSNYEVLQEIEAVVAEILDFLKDPHRLAKECATASPGRGRGLERERFRIGRVLLIDENPAQ
jgi:very-short-patch-repair endonuclease